METTPSAPAADYRATFKAECDRRRAAGLLLTGNTYVYRETLGKDGLGGIWDSRAVGWLMPTREAYEKGLALISRPTKKRPSRAKKAAPAAAAEPAVEFVAAPTVSAESSDEMPF